MTFSVRVVNGDGDPVGNIKVMVDFGLWSGHLIEYTNDAGWAEFEASKDYSSAIIHVNNESQGSHSLEEGETFSFTIED